MDMLTEFVRFDDDASNLNGPQPGDWKAELDLVFEWGDGRTRLIRRRHCGPLVVQRPFYPEKDGTCHVYLLHPPGGVVGGDDLHQFFNIGEGARCVLTTPGATKFYRSALHKGSQRNVIVVGTGAVCEYLPQENIVFDGANAQIETRVTLADEATFVGWDFICLGRPAANERFTTGTLSQRIEIIRKDEKVWFERCKICGGSPSLDACYAYAAQPVFGTMVYAGRLQDGLAEHVRNSLSENTSSAFSVSQLEHVVVCRYMGEQAEEGKNLFIQAWNVLRSICQSKSACLPRIWAT
jgi:urease accessory protein